MIPQRVHLVGIGGAGMAGLAHYLFGMGRTVSGSDKQRSTETARLEAMGVAISYTHAAKNVEGSDLVVLSDAIATDNVEMEAARSKQIASIRRAECLGRLADDSQSVFVAGSHGKSTTTAMIAYVLRRAGRAPSFIVGADIACLGDTRAHVGEGTYFVAEACEAFRNLESLDPRIAVLTNIDDEHVNHYASQHALNAAFADFAKRADLAIVCGDDPGVARVRASLGEFVTYGLAPDCDVSAASWPAPFAVVVGGCAAGQVDLRLPGDHMRRNALAAVATCLHAGVPFEEIAAFLAEFTGVARRWQDIGTAGGVRFIDDYAHHPVEIETTLLTARQGAQSGRVVAVFQPLLHSRLQRLRDAFVESLASADVVFLLELDPGGEVGSSCGSRGLADGLRTRGGTVFFHEDIEALSEAILGRLREGDVVVVMGARGVEGLAEQILQLRREPRPGYAVGRSLRHRIGDRLRPPRTVVDLFRKQARARPRDIAVQHRATSLSYRALDAASDAVASALAARGLTARPIGVALPHSIDLVVAALGIMKAGSTYLPLDASLPRERARYMLDNAQAAGVISRETWEDRESLSLRTLTAHRGSVPRGPTDRDTSYICFTSGSTGYPKGIGVKHFAFVELLLAAISLFEIAPGMRMAMNTSVGFDVSLAEIFGTLAGGGTLVIGGTGPLVGERLADFLSEDEVTHLSVTPTVLASVPLRPLPALRCIVSAGEAVRPKLVEDWAPSRRFINAYGPTEATIYATATDCVAGDEITIGHPLPHVAVHVLDERLRPMAEGAIGELCLSGRGVAEGYIAREDETRKRFVTTAVGRVYRTGDMVRLAPTGVLHFVGRADDQVKLLGNRIELEEIERTVLRQPGVADAAACVGDENNASLFCFVSPQTGAALDPVVLIDALAAWLPQSAVPAHVIVVDSLPLTPSGKRDRRRLLRDHRAQILTWDDYYLPPGNDIEARLAKVWRRVLKLDRDVGMVDRFASLGGDSLIGLVLVAEIEGEFEGLSIPPGYFGRLTTIQRMAVLVADLLWHRHADVSQETGFKGSRVFAQMLDLCGHWSGHRATPTSLISTLGDTGAQHDLFLCCQNEEEFVSLHRWLPATFRVHAMRSGHLVIDQGATSLRQLSSHYVDEICRIGPTGTLVLAGVCQGGVIAQIVAEDLGKRGCEVALLCLIEPMRPRHYPGNVAIMCGDESFRNPLHANGIGRKPYDEAFGPRYSIDTVPSVHGQECVEPAVRILAQHVTRRTRDVALSR